MYTKTYNIFSYNELPEYILEYIVQYHWGAEFSNGCFFEFYRDFMIDDYHKAPSIIIDWFDVQIGSKDWESCLIYWSW